MFLVNWKQDYFKNYEVTSQISETKKIASFKLLFS